MAEAHGVSTTQEVDAIHTAYKRDVTTFRAHTEPAPNGDEKFGDGILRICPVCNAAADYAARAAAATDDDTLRGPGRLAVYWTADTCAERWGAAGFVEVAS